MLILKSRTILNVFKMCETNHQYTFKKATKSRMYKQDFY